MGIVGTRLGPGPALVLRAGLVLAALLAAQPSRASRQHPVLIPKLLRGRAIVLAEDFGQRQPSKRLLFVRSRTGEVAHVQFSDGRDAGDLHTGMAVQVEGVWLSRGTGGTRTVSGGSGTDVAQAAAVLPPPEAAYSFLGFNMQTSGAPRASPKVARSTEAVPTVDGETVTAASVVTIVNPMVTSEINTLVIPIEGRTAVGGACPGSQPPKATIDSVRKAVFQELNPKGTTLGSLFNDCSFGKNRLTAQNSLVVDPVVLPCANTTNGVPWTFSKCDFDDFNGWADAAEEVVRSRSVAMEKYKYRVYLIPPSQCKWVGVGYIGCDGSPGFECRAWVNGNQWATPQALMHEMGHNLYMAHATAPRADGSIDDYGDKSCTMGYCCVSRCFNTPHAWQLGWINVQQLDGTSLKPGVSVLVTMASQSTSSRSGLRILPSWSPASEPVFVGFRTKIKGDLNLTADYLNKVLVYTANITNTYDSKKTVFRAGLAVGKVWEQPTAGLVIQLRGFQLGQALVRVCRKVGAETATSCNARIDNDCNGLVGTADPACQKLRKRRPFRKT